MIKGLEKLSPAEIDFISKVNENQKLAYGSEDAALYDVTEVWKEDGVICVRLGNGDWYHYLANGTWY